MILKSFDLKKINLNISKFILFYGKNEGLKKDTINILTDNKNEILNYEEKEILDNQDNFISNILSKSLFEKEKIIIIKRATDKIVNLIDNLSSKNLEDTVIIINADHLEKKSKLRNLFEKNKEIICVPFYEDTYKSLILIAQNFFKERKIRISSQSINLIIERSKGNRIDLKNELNKIDAFCKQKTSIEMDEILKLTNLSENYNFSELVDQCLAKNKKQTLNMLNENNQTSEDNIILIKTFLYKLKRLQKLQIELEEKKDLDDVLSSFRPQIFWKDKEVVKKQLKTLPLNQIKRMKRKINNLELLVKKNSQISNEIINNFIYESLN